MSYNYHCWNYSYIPSVLLRPAGNDDQSSPPSSLTWLATCEDSVLELLHLPCREGGEVWGAPGSGETDEAPPARVPDDEEENGSSHGPSQPQKQQERTEAEAEEVEESFEQSQPPLRSDDSDDLQRVVVVVVMLLCWGLVAPVGNI